MAANGQLTGMLGNNTGNPAIDALVQGGVQATQDVIGADNTANSELASGLTSGLNYLQNYLASSTAITAGQTTANNGALDQLQSLLGINTGVSSATQEADQAYTGYNTQLQSLQSQYDQINDQLGTMQSNYQSMIAQYGESNLEDFFNNTYKPQFTALQQQAGTYQQQIQQLQAQYPQYANGNPNAANGQQSGTQNNQGILQTLENTPDYQFTKMEGISGIENSAAAAGVLNSTGTLGQIGQYAANLASTTYQNAVSNDQNLITSTNPAVLQNSNNTAVAGQQGLAANLSTAGNESALAQNQGSNLGNIAMGEAAGQSAIYEAQQQQAAQLGIANANASAAQSGFAAGSGGGGI
jgi:hypothetical protein